MIQYEPGVTNLLERWRDGDQHAGEEALGLVYGDLRRVAARFLGRERADHTLQPTALVHEAWLRIVGGADPGITGRAHLIGVAARLMRQILVNHARDRGAARRGGGWKRVPLDPTFALFQERCDDVLRLNDALDRLAEIDPVQSRIVELRFFGGLTTEEIAGLLDSSTRTIEREWAMARAWLHREVRAA